MYKLYTSFGDSHATILYTYCIMIKPHFKPKDYTLNFQHVHTCMYCAISSIGYLGQMVFCDKCLEPSKGLAFRLARQNISLGDFYDLCHKCYDECEDEHMRSCFYCNIPSGNIDQEDR